MKCKDCTYFWKMVTTEYGGCSLMENISKIEADSDCLFLHKGNITCKDCKRLGCDTACFTAEKENNATDCRGFIPLGDDIIYDGFLNLLKIGMYSRKHINELLDQFESDRIFKFIEEHQNEE